MAQDKGAKSAGAKGKAAAAGSAPQSNVLLLAAVCVGAVGVAAYYLLAQRSGADRAILQPLKAKRLTDLEQFSPAYKDEMLWGSYRSGLYFGMRTRYVYGSTDHLDCEQTHRQVHRRPLQDMTCICWLLHAQVAEGAAGWIDVV